MPKNLGLSLADCAIESIQKLNSSRTYEIYAKIQQAQKENDEVAKAQRKKGFSHGASAAISIALNLAGEVFKNANIKAFGEVLCSMARSTPDAVTVYSSTLDGRITTHSHTRDVATTGERKATENDSSMNNQISTITKLAGDILSQPV